MREGHDWRKQIFSGFFTHVFIDEAGQCTEPEMLIGLAGLISEQSRISLYIESLEINVVF